MENEYSSKLEKLANNFQNLILFSKKLDQEKLLINEQLQHFKDTHSTLTKSNNKQVFIFCLDSFLFQYKVFSMEINNLNKIHLMIKNRLYCDYYKLYKMLLKYISSNFDDLKINVNELPIVPVYKDLEPIYDYGYSNIELVHNVLLECIKKITVMYLKKEQNISDYQTKTNVGFGISNFINTMNHEKEILKGKIDLHIDYIAFFNISQFKYMRRLHNVYSEFDKQLKNTVSEDHSFCFADILKENNDDILILDEIKDSIPEEKESHLETKVKFENDKTAETEIEIKGNEKEQINELKESNNADIPTFESIENLNNENK
tara:strand:+ start:3872 stop:4825 length:954 start_codon:yes stop_codon:yes gene_type:complete